MNKTSILIKRLLTWKNPKIRILSSGFVLNSECPKIPFRYCLYSSPWIILQKSWIFGQRWSKAMISLIPPMLCWPSVPVVPVCLVQSWTTLLPWGHTVMWSSMQRLLYHIFLMTSTLSSHIHAWSFSLLREICQENKVFCKISVCVVANPPS